MLLFLHPAVSFPDSAAAILFTHLYSVDSYSIH